MCVKCSMKPSSFLRAVLDFCSCSCPSGKASCWTGTCCLMTTCLMPRIVCAALFFGPGKFPVASSREVSAPESLYRLPFARKLGRLLIITVCSLFIFISLHARISRIASPCWAQWLPIYKKRVGLHRLCPSSTVSRPKSARFRLLP